MTFRALPPCRWNTRITTRTAHNSLRILERSASLTKLITLMNAVACGASFRRDRRGQERHLHEARPHVNSWVRIRSRLRRRCWDIWCSSHLLRRRKRRAPAMRIGADPRRKPARVKGEPKNGKEREEEEWNVLLSQNVAASLLSPRRRKPGGATRLELSQVFLTKYAKPHTCLTS